jgi:hypothetical protein
MGWWAEDGFWKVFKERYPEDAIRLIADAEAVLSGTVTLFQWKKVHLYRPFRWSAALGPYGAGEEDWPEIHYTDVKVQHDPRRPERDVKWCWELNRFQHLLCLGAAWRLTNDDRFAREARDQLESWMQSVRYPLGVQWSSNLEVALRGLSWARCHILCANSPSWDSPFVGRLITSLYLHLSHVHQELTIHHPPGNHLLGESSALLYLSLVYPLFTRSAQWRSRSVAILNQLVPRLILPDGVYAEQSTGYFRFVCELLLPLLESEPRGGPALAPIVWERLAAGLNWANSLSPSGKDMPMLGDSDTGVAIGWRLSDFWDFAPVVSAGAVLLHRSDLISRIDRFPAEAFLMAGIEGLETFDRLVAERTAHTAQTWFAVKPQSFPRGSYEVSSDAHFRIAFDAGPLGLSPSYGHGHADGLSWVLYWDDTPVITDPGTCHYNARRVWREYFRSMSAHNTIQIDGMAPSRPLGSFRWSRNLAIRGQQPFSLPAAHAVGGFMRWGRVAHHRLLLHVFNEGLIVSDSLEGTGEHDVEYRLHFDPRWDVRMVDSASFVASCGSASLDCTLLGGKGDLSILAGSESPLAGWYARYYGHRIPASTLLGRSRGRLPRMLLLVIKPSGHAFDLPEEALCLFHREALEMLLTQLPSARRSVRDPGILTVHRT